MPPVLTDVLGLFGFIIRLIGFLVFGFAVGRFVLDNYKAAEWQLKIALILGLFGLAVAFTDFASPGSSGAFTLGAGAAFLMANLPKKEDQEKE